MWATVDDWQDTYYLVVKLRTWPNFGRKSRSSGLAVGYRLHHRSELYCSALRNHRTSSNIVWIKWQIGAMRCGSKSCECGHFSTVTCFPGIIEVRRRNSSEGFGSQPHPANVTDDHDINIGSPLVNVFTTFLQNTRNSHSPSKLKSRLIVFTHRQN